MRIGNVGHFFRACQVACIVLGILLVGSCIAFKIGIGIPKADYTIAPVSYGEFCEHSHLNGVPLQATNLYYAHSQAGFVGFVEMYRFDAPATDCVTLGERLLRSRSASKDAKLAPLKAAPDPLQGNYLDRMGLAKVNWFDVDTIRSGFVGHQDVSEGLPSRTFWIDTDRGRFYYYSSD
jgi:hypothetical protein